MPRASHLAIATLVAAVLGCGPTPPPVQEIAHFPLDDLTGVLSREGVTADAAVSSDGHGSLKVTSTGPTTVRLFEVTDPGVEDAVLFYRARMRTEALHGRAYLEMWTRFPGLGEFFSRDLQTPITGSVEWSSEETPFFLEKGQKPDLVKLNLVVEGAGTVWVDDVRLVAARR